VGVHFAGCGVGAYDSEAWADSHSNESIPPGLPHFDSTLPGRPVFMKSTVEVDWSGSTVGRSIPVSKQGANPLRGRFLTIGLITLTGLCYKLSRRSSRG